MIERRRKNRRLRLALIVAGGVLAVGLIAALIIFLSSRGCAPSEGPTDISVPDPSAAPSPGPAFTDAPDDVITPSAPPAPTGDPVRVSDEQSSAIVRLVCSAERGAEGAVSMSFLNNTDRVLYAAEFGAKGLEITFASVGAIPVRFTVEDGVLTIPLIDELPVNGSVELYFEFRADLGEDGVSLPSIGYDTSFLLTAFADSDARLSFSGCDAEEARDGADWSYTVRECPVHEVKISRIG